MGFLSTSLTLSETLVGLNTVSADANSVPLPDAVGIASSAVSKWLAPSQAVDQLALNVFNKITQRQLDIATLGGNTGLASACYSANTAVVTSLYGSLVSGVGVTFGTTLGIVGVGTMTNVAFGSIKYDTLQAFRYPNMETATLNSSSNNPLDGEGYVTLTSSNLGIGKSTRYTAGAGSNAGTVFALQSSGCASYTGIANSISSVKAQYDTESAGIVTFVNDVNVIKGFKNTSQLEYWSLNKSSNNLSVGISSNNSVLTLLSDPVYGGPY